MSCNMKKGWSNLRRKDGVIMFIVVSAMTVLIVLSLAFWAAVSSEMTDIKEDFSVEKTYQAAVSVNDWVYDYIYSYISTPDISGGYAFDTLETDNPLLFKILNEMTPGQTISTGNITKLSDDGYGDCDIKITLNEQNEDPVTGKTEYGFTITTTVTNGKNTESFARDCIMEAKVEELPDDPGELTPPEESELWMGERTVTVTPGTTSDAYSTLVNIIKLDSWKNTTYDIMYKEYRKLDPTAGNSVFKPGMKMNIYYSGGDIQIYVMGKSSAGAYQWADVTAPGTPVQTLTSSQISSAGIVLPGTIYDIKTKSNISLSSISSSIDPYEVKKVTFTYEDMLAGINRRRGNGDIQFTASQVYKIATQIVYNASIIRKIEIVAPSGSTETIWNATTDKAVYKDAPKTPDEGVYSDMLTIVKPETATDPANNILGVSSFNFIRPNLNFYVNYTDATPRMRITSGAENSVNIDPTTVIDDYVDPETSETMKRAVFTYEDIMMAIGGAFSVNEIDKVVIQNQDDTTTIKKITWYNSDSADINGDPVYDVEPTEGGTSVSFDTIKTNGYS